MADSLIFWARRAVIPWAVAHLGLWTWAVAGPDAPVLSFALAFAAVGLVVVVAAEAARDLEPRLPVLAGAFVAGVVVAWVVGRWAEEDGLRALVHGYALLLPGTLIGVRLGREVVDRAHIWPLVLVAGAADLWSVVAPAGLTRAVLEGRAPVALSAVVLQVPAAGGIAPILGLGDVVFCAFLVGAAARLALPPTRAHAGLGLGFLTCFVGLVAAELPLPALPFLGLGFAAVQGRAVRPRPRELALALAVGGLILAAGALIGTPPA